MSIEALVFSALFLLGTFLLQVTSSAFRVLEHTQPLDKLGEMESFYVYRTFQRLFFRTRGLEILFFCISCSKHIYRFFYAISATLLVWTGWIQPSSGKSSPVIATLVSILLIFLSLVIGDFIPRTWGNRKPGLAMRITAPFASIYLMIITPINYLILLCTRRAFSEVFMEPISRPVEQLKEKIIEMIHRADAKTTMEKSEVELLESVATLRDTIVREVMVPRLDMFCLPHDTTLREAASAHNEKGYSRIPVYDQNVDHIVGLLYYKDIAGAYLKSDQESKAQLLDGHIDSLVKPVLYVPETSKVSHVLQEFRRRQTHLAIVVDEYGGTEGLVTIEDCIEEIVGDIADEYDVEEEELYKEQPGGGWIVDARMTISDIEDEFDIKVPQEGEYDTIGGYAFHRAGEIPSRGLKIYHDDFELEVLESTDRSVEKVLIKPTKKPKGKKIPD